MTNPVGLPLSYFIYIYIHTYTHTHTHTHRGRCLASWVIIGLLHHYGKVKKFWILSDVINILLNSVQFSYTVSRNAYQLTPEIKIVTVLFKFTSIILSWWQVFLNFFLNISVAGKHTVLTECTNMFLLIMNYEEWQR